MQADHAWILRFGALPGPQGTLDSQALLDALVAQLATRGVRRISVLLPDGEAEAEALTQHGFTRRDGLSYHHLALTSGGGSTVVERLGGHYIAPDLLKGLAGMNARRR